MKKTFYLLLLLTISCFLSVSAQQKGANDKYTAIHDTLAKYVRYPVDQADSCHSALIALRFTISTEGKIGNITASTGVNPSFYNEAKKALLLTNNQWESITGDSKINRSIQIVQPFMFLIDKYAECGIKNSYDAIWQDYEKLFVFEKSAKNVLHNYYILRPIVIRMLGSQH